MSQQNRYHIGMALLLIGVLIALYYIVTKMTGQSGPNTAIAVCAVVFIIVGRVMIRRYHIAGSR